MAAESQESGIRGVPAVGRYEARLLVWLLVEAGGQVGIPVPTAPFGLQQNMPERGVTAVVDSLEERDWVRVHERRSSGPVISLCEEGREKARGLDEERTDPESRRRYTENALVAWAYENRGTMELPLRDFFVTPHIFLHGAALTEDEVAEAASYLQRERLLTLADDHRDDTRTLLSLTSSGTACAAAGDGVEAYLAQRRDWDMSVQDFAELIREQGQHLGLSEADMEALLHDTAQLEQEEPGPAQSGRLRQSAENINSRLRGAPRTAGREILIESVKEALKMFL